jgi:hypothetical protein
MTKEEAIIDIRENIQPIIGGKSLDIAINAIEKQIPKKPLNIEETKYKVSYKCPVCETVHVNGWCGTNWKLPFCSICGQALDWRDTE